MCGIVFALAKGLCVGFCRHFEGRHLEGRGIFKNIVSNEEMANEIRRFGVKNQK